MDLIKWISVCLAGLMIGFSAAAQDKKLSFYEKLQVQERLERQNLEKMIESVSDQEYQSYLNDQLSKTMKTSGNSKATVIVDVTDMQSAKTALKQSEAVSLGAMKLKSIMAQARVSKSYGTGALNMKMTIVNKQWEFSNKTKTQQFEQVNVELGGGAISMLLRSADVKDIFVVADTGFGTEFSAINTELGRFYPPVTAKVYDKDFLREGYLKELMTTLGNQDTASMSVTLKGYPEVGFLSDQDYERGYQIVDEVLSSLVIGEYELLSKSAFGFSLEAGADVVDQLREDDRVDMISENTSREFGVQ